jgi:hypothetical protein
LDSQGIYFASIFIAFFRNIRKISLVFVGDKDEYIFVTVLKSVGSQGSLGVKDIFEANTADLSEISRERLEVGDVLHSAQLEVNEEGSEAAAVTSIDIDIRLAASGNNGTDNYLHKLYFNYLSVALTITNNLH